ncbi:hypothetical protein L915_11719, partial [Phytophthora nicotianae]
VPAEVPAEVPAQTVPEEEAAPTKAEPAVDAEVSEVMAAVLSQVSIVPAEPVEDRQVTKYVTCVEIVVDNVDNGVMVIPVW